MFMPQNDSSVGEEYGSCASRRRECAPMASALMQELVRGAAASVGLERAAIAWWDARGLLLTQATPGLALDAVEACGRRLREGWLPEPGSELGGDSLLALPVRAPHGQYLGVLLGASHEPRTFSPEEMRRFGLYAQLAGLALERAANTGAAQTPEEMEPEPVARLTGLQAVGEALARALTREEVGRAVLGLGLPVVGAVGGRVHEVTEDVGAVELVAAVGPCLEAQEACQLLLVEEAHAGGGAVVRGTPVWLESPEEVEAHSPALAARLSRHTFVLLPLMVEHRWVGLLTLAFASPTPLAEARRTELRALARLCAQALERTRLHELERSARLQAEAVGQRLLADAGVLLSGALEWETAVAGVAQQAVGGFCDGCAVDFLDEDGAVRRLTLRQACEGLETLPLERSCTSAMTEVLRTGRSRLATGGSPASPLRPVAGGEEGTGGDPYFHTCRSGRPEASARCAEAADGGSLLVVPLVARRRTLGTLSFQRGPQRPAFTEADCSLAEELGGRSGLAIDTARLLRAARAAEAEACRHAARLRTLGDVDRLLAEAGLDLPAVLDVIAHKVSEVIGEGCVLQLVREEEACLEPVAVHHPDPEARWVLKGTVHARRQKVGQGLHGGVVTSGREAWLEDVDETTSRAGSLPEYWPFLERYGAQSMLVVPLAVRGRVLGTLGVLRDVAGAGVYTEEERLLLRSLAERAALAIEDARLYGAATEAVRLRDDFLSVAGHELKTPLSALRLQIQLLARLLKASDRGADFVQRVAKAERSTERLGALVDELLEAGRISAGRLKLEREEVDLGGLTRDTLGRMSEDLAHAGNEVTLEVGAAVVGRWDRVRLEQVVGNLLSNAAKYGRGQPVEVRVALNAEGRAFLSVRDQGIGIALEDQPRIFERFERAVTDKQFRGLGLGLWITREIIESHGGHIQVRSAPGKGSTFIVELPLE